MRVTSKLCGIGPAEISWGGVKQIKDGKRSHAIQWRKEPSCLFLQKYHRLELCDHMEKLDAKGQKAMFGDDDTNFDLELERFGVDMRALKE